jgi:hypothetical protein
VHAASDSEERLSTRRIREVVADVPDTLVLERHRDLEGRRKTVWVRRAILGLIALFVLLGVANVFGQRPATTYARAPAATLKLYAPSRLRGGLLFSARFHVYAHADLKKATLVLDPGWAEGMSINTIEPSPVGEASKDGRLSLDLGHIPAGQSHILFVQFQVNPTNVAWHRPARVELDDGNQRVLRIDHSFTIFP